MEQNLSAISRSSHAVDYTGVGIWKKKTSEKLLGARRCPSCARTNWLSGALALGVWTCSRQGVWCPVHSHGWTEEEGGGAKGAGKTRCPRLGEWRQPHNERPGALTRRTPTVKARVVPVRPARCTPGTGDWHGVVTSISGNPLRHRFRHGGQWPWKARRRENIRQPKLLRNGEGGCASPALEKKYAKMRRENALRISPVGSFPKQE